MEPTYRAGHRLITHSILDQGKVEHVVVPEINLGQLVLEVERQVCGRATVSHVPHAGGAVHHPSVIRQAIEEAAR